MSRKNNGMHTLLLFLSAPLMRFGDESKMSTRRTYADPSKSAVIGMICAAMGLDRETDLSRFRALGFGSRTESQGELTRDYHIMHHESDHTEVTYRYYLDDASFIVGLESDDKGFLEEISNALQYSANQLYYGVRACSIGLQKLVLGIVDKDLETALKEEPWHANINVQRKRKKEAEVKLKLVMDAKGTEATGERKDDPVSFSIYRREYENRPIVESEVTVINPEHVKESHCTAPDPFDALDESIEKDKEKKQERGCYMHSNALM